MMRCIAAYLLMFCFMQSVPSSIYAQSSGESILEDRTGDGTVSVLAFGDSLTVGVGDAEEAGGYPSRLMQLLGLPVLNKGVAGENFCSLGYERFPQVLAGSNSDIALIFEGENDARVPESDDTYQRYMQRVINTAIVLNRQPVLVTLPQACCEHALLAPYTPGYSAVLRELATINSIPYVDVEHVWGTTCQNKGECELFNIPEGLHPNALGYTAIAQAMAASLLGINIFDQDGAQNLEKALGLPTGTVIVKPDAVTQ